MTEKRFGELNQKRFIISIELDDSCGIEDLLKNKKYSHFREKDYHKLKIIRDELNELYYENEQLKQQNNKLKEDNKSWMRTASRMDTIHHEDREYCERVHKENEQLKQSMDKLFDYFAKWFEKGGVYIEEFGILWKHICDGDME